MSNKERAKYWWRWSIEHGEPPCGYGSTYSNTRATRSFLSGVIRDLNIASMNDAGCGDFRFWMQHVDLASAVYRGFDINGELIKHNKTGFPSLCFEECNIVEEILPRADLILCRDCLSHLTINDAKSAIDNFRKSGSRYLAATTYVAVESNKELDHYIDGPEMGYGFMSRNLALSPFNLRKCIRSEREWIDRKESPFDSKRLGVWRIN